MSGVKGRSGGPRPNSGGRRPGAGRPPRTVAAATAPGASRRFETAEAYLEAVVRGDEPPDAARLTAARTLLAYERPRIRSPMPSTVLRQSKRAVQAERDRVRLVD